MIGSQQSLVPAELPHLFFVAGGTLAVENAFKVAGEAVQALGGMGFMRGTKSERIYREVKVNMIGGGAEEIMKDLAARQLAY